MLEREDGAVAVVADPSNDLHETPRRDDTAQGEVAPQSVGETLGRPKKILTRACQLLVSRGRGQRPKTKRLTKKDSPNKAGQKKGKPQKQGELPETAPTDDSPQKATSPEKRSKTWSQKSDPKSRIPTRLSRSVEAVERQEERIECSVRCTSPTPCCFCRAREGVACLDDHTGSTPVLAFTAGRVVGRAFIPSGSFYLHASLPQRSLQLVSSRDEGGESRGMPVRAATPPRTRTGNRVKSQSKRAVDIQRPLSGMSQSASSPLSQGPIRRIDGRHDVLTPDQYFNATHSTSPKGATELLEETDGHLHRAESSDPPDESHQIQEYRKQLSELQFELELLRSETERQRIEREKYQKLYEGTALCQICMERRRNSFILPCSHFVYCGECLERHWEVNHLRQCPLCRGPAHSVIITNLGC